MSKQFSSLSALIAEDDSTCLRIVVKYLENLGLKRIVGVKSGEEAITQLSSAAEPFDLVISDIPYGNQSHWELSAAAEGKQPVWLLLENLREVLAARALVAIASAKQERSAHEAYRQVGKLKVGKRQVVFLEVSKG